MSISQYIKEIGRGKEGTRSLSRAQVNALLLRGTESEAAGQRLQAAQTGTLAGKNPLPVPVTAQMEHILLLVSQI